METQRPRRPPASALRPRRESSGTGRTPAIATQRRPRDTAGRYPPTDLLAFLSRDPLLDLRHTPHLKPRPTCVTPSCILGTNSSLLDPTSDPRFDPSSPLPSPNLPHRCPSDPSHPLPESSASASSSTSRSPLVAVQLSATPSGESAKPRRGAARGCEGTRSATRNRLGHCS